MYERLKNGSVDPMNVKKYEDKQKQSELKEKELVNNNQSGIITSGAISGARNPNGKAAEKHAKKYYGLVRSMKTDVAKVSQVTGYSENEIQEIKSYIYMDKNDLGGTELEYLAPDFMMGESWRRLIDGKPEAHDLTLIKHEIIENSLVKQGFTQLEAYKIISVKYNYNEEAKEFYGNFKKYKKE